MHKGYCGERGLCGTAQRTQRSASRLGGFGDVQLTLSVEIKVVGGNVKLALASTSNDRSQGAPLFPFHAILPLSSQASHK